MLEEVRTAVAAAFKVLETVEALDELPATNDAFRAGRLSAEQAHEIAGAAAKDPGAEHELLGAARGTSLKGLRDRCRLVRANAEADDAAWAERLRASRSMPLHALMTRGPRKATAATLVIDEAVPARGYALPGERCEITGMGPSPVTIAKAMFEDAKVRTVPRDPAALPEHSSDSRYYPAWLTAWLDAKYPVCGAKGCDADFRLQYDHVIAMEDGGRTERDNLWRLCPHHHDLKTNYGWRVTGTTHSWDLEPPDDPDPP